MYGKDFLRWIHVKEKLDSNSLLNPVIRRGDIWWCSVGENVGVEVSGKGDRFTRPVMVLIEFNRNSFLAVPLTSVPHEGKNYVTFSFNNVQQFGMLSQTRTFSHKRLSTFLGHLEESDYKMVKDAFLRLFPNIPP